MLRVVRIGKLRSSIYIATLSDAPTNQMYKGIYRGDSFFNRLAQVGTFWENFANIKPADG